MRSIGSFLISLLFPCLIAAQGVKMTNVVTTYGDKEYKNESTLWVTEGHLKTDSKSRGRRSSTLFNAEEEVLYTIDHERKRYQKITKENIEQMEKMMERMKNLPESSKKMMEEKMGDLMENERPDISYEKTGKTKNVSPWGKCQEWKGVDENGDLYNKVYTTSKEDAGVKVREEHAEVMRSMIDFFSFMPEGADRKIPVNEGGKEELQGIGVLWIYYDESGKKTQRVHLKEMKEKRIDPSVFEIPSDYEGSDMNMGGGARR